MLCIVDIWTGCPGFFFDSFLPYCNLPRSASTSDSISWFRTMGMMLGLALESGIPSKSSSQAKKKVEVNEDGIKKMWVRAPTLWNVDARKG